MTNGVLTTTIALARELQRRGHCVIFIAPAWKAFHGSKVEGIPVEYVPSIPSGIYPGVRLTWPGTGRVRRLLRRRGVDVVHLTAQGTLSWSCLRAARGLGLPVVSTLHTLIFEPEYLRYAARLLGPLNTERIMRRLQAAAWALVRRFLQRSDIVTAPSRYACRLIEANCPGVRPRHLPNCVSVGCASGALGADEARTFVYVGRLGREKSVDVLLEGFFRAWKVDRRLRLVVVGDGPQAAACRQLAESLRAEAPELPVDGPSHGESATVVFTGRLQHGELLESGLLRGARALVSASTTENQPVSVLEAISLGRPVIVPDVAGINELVDGNGSRFPAGDAAALAGELLRMAWDDEFFAECAAGARALARAGRYAAERVAERYERVYLGLEGRELVQVPELQY